MLRAWQLQAGSAADCFTRKMAGTDRIFRWGQNHREMPAGTAYHHKERNKERFRGIKFSVNLGNLLTAQNAPPLSCADVQEEATAGSTKPAETVHYISITFFGTLLAGLDKKI